MWYATNRKTFCSQKVSGGFTLTELIVALAVFSLVATGITFFGLQTARLMAKAELQLDVTQAKRGFTDVMIMDGVNSYEFKLFASIDNTEAEMTDGMIGNYLLLYFQNIDGKVTKTVSYFKDPRDGKNGPVYRHVHEFKKPLDPKKKESTLNPTLAELRKAATVAKKDGRFFVGDSIPLFTKRSGVGEEINVAPYGIFLNYFDQVVIMRGELLPLPGSKNKENEEYNLVISPR